MYSVSFNPQKNPRNWILGRHWEWGWPFKSFSDPHTVSIDSPSLDLLKILLLCMTIESITSLLQMRKMRLREQKYFVIINDSGRVSGCKWGFLPGEITGGLGLVYSPMRSYVVPPLKKRGQIHSSKELCQWEDEERKTREQPLLVRKVRKPHSLHLTGHLTERHLTSASHKMSKV